MNSTPRPHFEETDWLDFIQQAAGPAQSQEMRRHLAGCVECSRRLDAMRRLSDAIPFSKSILFEEAASGDGHDAAVARRAAAAISERAPVDRTAMSTAFAEDAPAAFPWTPEELETACAITRELLRSDFARAGRIARSAIAAIESGVEGTTTEGTLRVVAAYARRMEGDSARALDELERARPIVEAGSRAPEDDLALWSYVSGSALLDLGRTKAALEAFDLSASLCRLLEDFPREARCRIMKAVIVADLGGQEEAIRIYEELLARESDLEDPRLVGMIYLNLGSDLIDVDRLADAKRAYARAVEILRKTGETARLARLRSGLAKMAAREGRYEDACEIAISLRSSFRSSNLGWDEIHLELRIADFLLHLGRSAEAAEVCRNLLPRIRELGLSAEAERAVEYLTQSELDLERVAKVTRFLERVEKGEDARWSVA
jgi:tetratricopeptide (TPR) repeat protein